MLDDISKYIDLKNVGIPFGVKAIKVIMTSRLRHVCREIDCLLLNMIEVGLSMMMINMKKLRSCFCYNLDTLEHLQKFPLKCELLQDVL